MTKAEQRVIDKVREAWDAGTPYRSKTEAVTKAGGNRQHNMAAWDVLLDKGLIIGAITADRKGFRAA